MSPIRSNNDPTMPQFVYPQNQDVGSANYNYNYLDTLNVSWSGSNTEDYQTHLVFYWVENGSEQQVFSNNTVDSSGSKTFQLNIGSSYPCSGHFNLIYIYANGTIEGGPNGSGFDVVQKQDAEPVIWTAPSSSSSSSSTTTNNAVADSTAHTATTTSNATSAPASRGLGGGAIGGLVAGILVVVLGLAALGFFLLRRRRSKKQLEAPLIRHPNHDLSAKSSLDEKDARPLLAIGSRSRDSSPRPAMEMDATSFVQELPANEREVVELPGSEAVHEMSHEPV